MERNKVDVKVVSISIPSRILVPAKRKAKELNISFSRYITSLIERDLSIQENESVLDNNSEDKEFQDKLKKLKEYYRVYVLNIQSDIPKWKAELEYRRLFEEIVEKYGIPRKQLLDMLETI